MTIRKVITLAIFSMLLSVSYCYLIDEANNDTLTPTGKLRLIKNNELTCN